MVRHVKYSGCSQGEVVVDHDAPTRIQRASGAWYRNQHGTWHKRKLMDNGD